MLLQQFFVDNNKKLLIKQFILTPIGLGGNELGCV